MTARPAPVSAVHEEFPSRDGGGCVGRSGGGVVGLGTPPRPAPSPPDRPRDHPARSRGDARTRRPTLVAALLLAVYAGGAGCDFTPALDIETPAHEPAVVLRAVLAAGREPEVRVSVSRDPYAEPERERSLRGMPTRVDGRLTLTRVGGAAEALAVERQTCYERRRTACDPETGRTIEVEAVGPFECGRYRGRTRVEAGATYTLRAEVPGLPPAEATVTVPPRPALAVERAGGGAAGAVPLRVRLRDAPGPSRYGLTVLHEVDRIRTSVCRPGGARDTVVALRDPWLTRVPFVTDDPFLASAARAAGGALDFASFDDASFADGERTFAIESPPATAFGATGAVRVEVAALSAELYGAYQITAFALDEGNPFAEPIDLPSNVVGGYGRVGAVSVAHVTVPAR